MAIPFDADWRRITLSSDTAVVLARWAMLEPSLAGADLDTLCGRARSRNVAESDATLAVLLRLAATDVLARRVIVEALMSRLVPIAAALARQGGEAYDDVLGELAGWAWELAATTAADRWPVLLAPKLARLAKRRYLAARPHHPVVHLGDNDPPATRDGLDEQLAVYEVGALLERAVTTGTISTAAACVLQALAITDATDRVIAQHLGRGVAGTKKTRERSLTQLRTWRPALALRAA
ncbi:MAG: hypothetical protein ACYDH6_22655 [Acidimicrobiales bacterium]